MQIWVDADACPAEVKALLFKSAKRRNVRVTLVANQPMAIPRSDRIELIVVAQGMNIADERIVELAKPGDLVITADVPLAADVVKLGATALNPRGELYTDANIGERLAVRDMLDEMRAGGRDTRGPAAYTAKNRQEFANQLDRWLAKNTAD